MNISKQTVLYLLALIFAIIGGIGLLIGVDVMTGLGGLAAIVSALVAQSPMKPPGSGGVSAPLLVLAAAGAALVTGCAPAWQAGGMGVAVVGQACEPAHERCIGAVAEKVPDPWEAEAATIACDTGLRYCDLGRRWAAHELARKAAEAAAREAMVAE